MTCNCDYIVYKRQIWVQEALQTFYGFSIFSQQVEPSGVQLFYSYQLTATFSQLTAAFLQLTAKSNTPLN
jgi:hypothetical protein